MKKLVVIMLLCATSLSFAQEKKWERIKALKTAYITEQLNLTTAEAENFWPIYNEFEKEKWELKKEERGDIFSKLNNSANLSEAEAQALIDKSIKIHADHLALHKKLYKDLTGVVPAKKLILLQKVEEDFKRKLLERYKDKKGH